MLEKSSIEERMFLCVNKELHSHRRVERPSSTVSTSPLDLSSSTLHEAPGASKRFLNGSSSAQNKG